MLMHRVYDGPNGAALSRGLGWFSIALGFTEIAAPNALARAIGIRADRKSAWLLRAIGLREIVAGIGILLRPKRPLPIWARLAGDLVDLAVLGRAASTRRLSTIRAAGALAAVAGTTALDAVAGAQTQRAFSAVQPPARFSVTINKPAHEVYAFFRDFERLPTFMDFLEAVTQSGSTTHWVAKLPIGSRTVAWDAVITEDRPGQVIAWHTVEGSRIHMRGRVLFEKTPGRNMTEVHVEMEVSVPVIGPSAAVAKYFALPQLEGDLRRLKQVLETGEVLRSDASAHALPHPAQPARGGAR